MTYNGRIDAIEKMLHPKRIEKPKPTPTTLNLPMNYLSTVLTTALMQGSLPFLMRNLQEQERRRERERERARARERQVVVRRHHSNRHGMIVHARRANAGRKKYKVTNSNRRPRDSMYRMVKTGIEYGDLAWNTHIGCLNNCEYGCWAKSLCEGRLKRVYEDFRPRFIEGRVQAGYRTLSEDFRSVNTRLPRGDAMVLTNFMGDMWGPWHLDATKERVLTVPPLCRVNHYVFLTKIPVGYRGFEFGTNSWVGVTVESRETASRIDRLRSAVYGQPCIRWVSFEPLIGRVPTRTLERVMQERDGGNSVDWAVIGPCGGPKASQYPCRTEWVKEIQDYCTDSGIAVYLKDELQGRGLHQQKEFPPERERNG